MARAMAPGKNVAFMCFMMWMVGNGIQLFSIIFTITGITQPITAMLGAAKREWAAGHSRCLCCCVVCRSFIARLVACEVYDVP